MANGFEVVNPATWAVPVKVVVTVLFAAIGGLGYVGTQIYSFSAQQQLILDELKKHDQSFTWLGGALKEFKDNLVTSDRAAQSSRDAINGHLNSIDLTLQRHQDALDTLTQSKRH
jgi:phage-related minor tail protein